ncbi:MAG: hypothetical protein ABF289_07015, partial [Clostridiales bacterium]
GNAGPQPTIVPLFFKATIKPTPATTCFTLSKFSGTSYSLLSLKVCTLPSDFKTIETPGAAITFLIVIF